ncbi:hypothetical protein FSP39_023684 [Pinctada imbricata]|uniref:TBC1 domain family member 2B n=1 Tax=Pinctada imbricata TaxID=66713 RepID=A0AA89BMX6_PINIB|nr:hypothetical protein FSP39_023684 [Pinctada imbricata]
MAFYRRVTADRRNIDRLIDFFVEPENACWSAKCISLLKTRKKVWCILEESQCQLVYFKNEEDFQGNRCPLGAITLKGAAITLDLESHNQFIIICDGKEYIFTAENHESMMIWLLGLQAKRDVCGEEGDSTDGEEVMTHDRHRIRKRQNEVPLSTTSPVGMTADSVSRRKPNWQKYKHERMAESVDTGFTVYRSKGENEHLETSRSRSLPPVFEAMECPRISSSQSHTRICMSKSLDIQRRISKDSGTGSEVPRKYSGAGLDLPKIPSGTTLDSYHRKHRSSRNGSVSSGDNSDDVFGEHSCKDPYGELACSKPLYMDYAGASKEEGRPTLNKLDTIDSSASGVDFPEQSENKDIGSCSSVSVSSDSAIDRGETSSAEMASRLMDLEKELITTKCELAKVMNRQSGYEELLAQRDDAIRFLEGRLDTSTPPESSKGNSLKKSKSSSTCKTDKELQERLRILQNQNRFLNQEVHKLAKLRQTDRGVFYQHEEKIRALEADIEKWKLDYVSLIQSSIRFPGGDTMDDAELVLFGGDRHKIRVQRLLDEARSINPSLPTYERLAQGEVHVDSYGFKHSFDGEDNGLLMHYLCQELTIHYLMQAGSYEQHQRKWTQFMRQHGKSIINHLKELKPLCRGGVPDRFRKHVWRQLVYGRVADLMEKRGQHYYRNLCNILPDSPLAACYRKQISLDLMRTMPSNTKFSTQGSKGVMDLQDVLLAYCVHNPTVGYCQGMNFIVGMALLFMDAHDAFWTLVAVTEHYFPSHYFDQNLIGAQADQQVLKDTLADKLPNLSRHLEGIDIEISTVTLNWFLAIFFDAVPFQTLLRIWDCFLLEGPKVLFRFALAILKIHERELLKKTDTISIMRHLKAAAKLTFDVDGLIKTAYEDLKPFPRRRDINTKQACYLNTLKEKHKKKELQKLAFAEREQLYMAMEAETGSDMTIGSAVVLEEGKAWLCYGSQNMAKVCKVTTEEGLMFDLNLEVDSRVMCMQKAGDRVIVVGTISWMLQAYDSTTRDSLWQMQLHDAVLSLYCYTDEEAYVTRTFAGLADGTLAVIEQFDVCKMSVNSDVMYVPVGQAPVACLLLVGENLWCASGNTVYIIHARYVNITTLDSIDNFNVSVNPYDHILSMVSGEYGIWISLRGSSILELWDPKSLNCKMLYDTRTDRYPQLRKEDDTYFNRARITAIMDLGHTVWVGTGEGNLIIYEIQEHLNLKTPTDLSPSIESMMGVHNNAHMSPRNRPRHSMSELRRLSASTPILNNDRASFSIGVDETASPVMTPDKERRIAKKTLAKLKMDFMSVKNNRICSVASETASTGTITPINCVS